MTLRHINLDEQALLGSATTQILADESITAAKINPLENFTFSLDVSVGEKLIVLGTSHPDPRTALELPPGSLRPSYISTNTLDNFIFPNAIVAQTLTILAGPTILTGDGLLPTLTVNSGDIDLTQHQARNFRLENRVVNPVPGYPGRLYYRTDVNKIYVDTGTMVVPISDADPVTGIRADANPYLVADVTFLSGAGIVLTQVGNDITIDATAVAAGSDTQIQFNDSGNFGASAGFTYDEIGYARLTVGPNPLNGGTELRLLALGNNFISFDNEDGTTNYASIYAGADTTGNLGVSVGSNIWTFDTSGIFTTPGAINVSTNQIHNVVDPTAPQDAATKQYVDDSVSAENLWDRTGTVLSPYNANDDLAIAGDATFTNPGAITSLYLRNDGNSRLFFTDDAGSTQWGLIDGAAAGLTLNTSPGRSVFVEIGPRVWTFQDDGKLNLPGGDAFRNIDSSPTAIGNLDITTAGALNLRTSNGSGVWVTDNGTITRVGINNNTPTNALDVNGETLLTADTSNFQLRITDTASGNRAGLRLASASSTYGVIELEGAENNANLQIRASADTTDIAISSVANLRFDAASVGWTLQTDGRISSTLSEILFDRSFGITNDSGGYVFFNSANNAITYANLVAGNDYTFKITGQNDISKWFIQDGYIVFGLNDFTQDASSFLTVWGKTSVGELSLRGNIAHDFGELGIGTSAAVPSAILDVVSSTRGFLPPRMTEAQRDAIASPATGLVVYNTDTNRLNIYDGVAWSSVGDTTVKRETPSGAMNGINTVFTLAFTPLVGSEEVYLNGMQQDEGAGNDYTISGAVITFAFAPLATDKIRVSYIK